MGVWVGERVHKTFEMFHVLLRVRLLEHRFTQQEASKRGDLLLEDVSVSVFTSVL